MKRILIIGASVLQLPAIQKAKEMGFHVGVADLNTQAVGIKYADTFFNVSTIDTEGIMRVAETFKPSGIMTLATDMPMRSISVVARKLNLPSISIESAIKATDKGEMIKAFKEHGVNAPWFFIINNRDELINLSNKIKYPCIIKPVDNAGSRGVVLVKEPWELNESYNYSSKHSRSGSVIVEEYMTGNEVSVEIMAIDSEIHILAITDKITTGPPYFVEMGHSQPSKLPEMVQQKIKDLTIMAMKALDIKNGPAHVEIMVTPEGPKMIELGARMGGDNITTHLVPLSTGIDMVKATIQLAIGEEPELIPKFNKGSAIKYLEASFGTIEKIKGIEDATNSSGVKELFLTKRVGDHVRRIQSSSDRIGYVIADGDTAEEALLRCSESINKIKILTC